MTPEFLAAIPNTTTLEPRFDFIDNDILRQNTAIYFRYVIFLSAASEAVGENTLKYALYKDIVIYTASIVESILGYTVQREILRGNADKSILGQGKKTETLSTINHECDDLYKATLQVVKVKKYFKVESDDRIDFKDITHAAKTAGILDKKLYEAAESMRTKRNTIHLHTLTKSSDDYFEKKDVDEIFSNAHDIIAAIELRYQPV